MPPGVCLAQEIAQEAVQEAGKGLASLRISGHASGVVSSNPLDYGITPDLHEFVASLTYSTFRWEGWWGL